MRYTVIQPIKHNGVRTASGAHIDLPAKVAERLLAIGAIEPDYKAAAEQAAAEQAAAQKAAADQAAAEQAAADKVAAEQAEKDAADKAAADTAATSKKADTASHAKGR